MGKYTNESVLEEQDWVKGSRRWGNENKNGNVQIFVLLLYQFTPSGQASEAQWQTDRCLLHTTVMFYQPQRPCQSMAGMFQNIFNTQREHFCLRKWIVHMIGRGLSGCVSHQRPFVLPLLQASRTKTFSFVSFVFVCSINCFTFGCRRKYNGTKKLKQNCNLSHTEDYR